MYAQKYHNIDLSKFSFLVTGGAGFIGFHTAKELLNKGHNVISVDIGMYHSLALK